jgi:hypothetical protein
MLDEYRFDLMHYNFQLWANNADEVIFGLSFDDEIFFPTLMVVERLQSGRYGPSDLASPD